MYFCVTKALNPYNYFICITFLYKMQISQLLQNLRCVKMKWVSQKAHLLKLDLKVPIASTQFSSLLILQDRA